MLQDSQRISLYQAAIQETLKSDSIAVEIGAGTGILTYLAAKQTKNIVYSIEYIPALAHLASKILLSLGIENVEVFVGRSYDILLNEMPDVLITETIGQVGLEENMVELCYNFKSNHSSIKYIIPYKIKLFAQPIFSPHITKKYCDLRDNLKKASYDLFNLVNAEAAIIEVYSTSIYNTVFADFNLLGNPVVLAEFVLGEAQHSDFTKTVCLDNKLNMNGLLIYFEAELANNIILSNHVCEPLTHWQHNYLFKPLESERLEIGYNSSTRKFSVIWS